MAHFIKLPTVKFVSTDANLAIQFVFPKFRWHAPKLLSFIECISDLQILSDGGGSVIDPCTIALASVTINET